MIGRTARTRMRLPAIMSALGQKRTFRPRNVMSALPPKADIVAYSISSSARESTELGTVRPSALAVLRLITKSNLVEA